MPNKSTTQTVDSPKLKAGDWVKNGSSIPGLITELVELKPGYPKAWIQWEGKQWSTAEDVNALTLIEPWALDWRWDNNNNVLVRHHDGIECNNLKFIIQEIKLCQFRLSDAKARKDIETIKLKTKRIEYLKKLKIKAIAIDKQFLNLVPPLSNDEYHQLEANLKEEGCRDAIVIWNNILIDGHNRFQLCKKHHLDFQLCFQDLPDRKAAHDWIIMNQLGRRNLSDKWLSDLRGSMYSQAKLAYGGDRKSKKCKNTSTEISRGQSDPLILEENTSTEISRGQSDPLILEENTSTAEKIAKLTNSSARTVKRDEKYFKALSKIIDNFGEHWKPIINSSKLTKTQVIQIAKYASREDCYEEIEAILNDVENKDDFKENYRLFESKVTPKTFEVGQLVRIKYKYKAGLTLVEKHCDREYGLINGVLEHSYELFLLGKRKLQLKGEDLESVSVAQYCLSFSPEEFERLCDKFKTCGEIEEEAKKLLKAEGRGQKAEG